MGCKTTEASARSQCQLHSRLLQLQFYSLLLLLLSSESQASSRQPYKFPTDLDMKASFIEALGLNGIPDVAKANVSQAEYERAHNEYLMKLQQRLLYDYHSSLFTLRPSGIDRVKGADGGSSVNLEFLLGNQEDKWHEKVANVAGNCSLESTPLRLLLQHREYTSQHLEKKDEIEMELRVYLRQNALGKPKRLLGRRSLRGLAPNQFQWLQLDLLQMKELLQRHSRLRQLHLSVQLLIVVPGKVKRFARGLSVSEAALNLHLECAHSDRPKRSPGRAPDELWSVHKGRRTECKNSGNASAKKCCRHEMSVNFKDLEGFDFIIQPKSFDAGYCRGRCPPRYNPAHHHALLQSLIWKGDRSKAPRPCCAPSKLAELEILYFDENEPTKLKVSNWKDMRVLECACS